LKLPHRHLRPDTHILSEQHPREQGLKLDGRHHRPFGGGLSEQHPREQGLKQSGDIDIEDDEDPFRATSKRTRIETPWLESPDTCIALSEQHPREQGLKLESAFPQEVPDGFQSNIQENKD